MMKPSLLLKSLSFLLLCCLFSCGKDFLEPEKQYEGFLQNFILSDPSVVVQKATPTDWDTESSSVTYRGYIFTPQTDIRLTAVGGLIAYPGTFPLEIYRMATVTMLSKPDTLLLDEIRITDANTFQYKTLGNPLELQANTPYLIRYKSAGHRFVYDAVFPETYPYDSVTHPVKTNHIRVDRLYFTNHNTFLGKERLSYEASYAGKNLLRGLLDFRYELSAE